MPKLTICIQNTARLSAEKGSLVITGKSGSHAIPFEDIWVLILETHQAQVTTTALSSLVDAGIGVMLCGDNHMPNGLLLPLGAHSRHAGIVEDQLAISKPLKKRLWQRIVVAKIINQARVLELLGKDSCQLRTYARQVLSGDTSNRESCAAAAYWERLLTEGGRRTEPYEAPLDYGYSVLRAGIARQAVSGGWLVSRGIHHSSSLNAFNLVDDLIEPFRPLVDLLVVSDDVRSPLSSEDKRLLASVFEYEVEVAGKVLGLQAAIECELDTLRSAVLDDDATRLQLPTIIPLRSLSFE